MIWDLMTFLTVVLLTFSIVIVIAGIFSIAYGRDKNRITGISMLVGGFVLAAVWVWLTGCSDIEPFCSVPLEEVFYETLIYVVGVLIGALIAVALFLMAALRG